MKQIIDDIVSIQIVHVIANDEESVRIRLTDGDGHQNDLLVSCLGKFDAVNFMRSDKDKIHVEYATLGGNEFVNVHAEES
tara:strand:+ start:248 stop:487 length:240 start_codon:yes stop_codon:yes gene_type:complete